MPLCRKCGETKPESFFYGSSKNASGIRQPCMACCNESNKAWIARNKEAFRAIQKRYKRSEKGRARSKLIRQAYQPISNMQVAEWKKANPEKVFAQQMALAAVRRGFIVQQPCEVCGDPNSEMHHESYALHDVFRVRWLCRIHHRAAHS